MAGKGFGEATTHVSDVKKKKNHFWSFIQIKSGTTLNDSCFSTGVKISADNQEIQSQIFSTLEFILQGLVFIILLFSNPIIVMFR